MYRLLLILFIVCQFIWLAATTPSLNILGDSYRQSERDRALAAWATNKTVVTKAAFDHETYILEAHRNFVTCMAICVFSVVDVFGFYLFWNYGKSKHMA